MEIRTKYMKPNQMRCTMELLGMQDWQYLD